MPRRPQLLALTMGCVFACATVGASAQELPTDDTRAASSSDTRLPVSLDRIRQRLEQPTTLLPPSDSGWDAASYPVPTPMFRIDIRQPMWVERPPDDETFDPTMGLPSLGELVVGGLSKIHGATSRYRKRRAERRAREDVSEDLAAFCRLHGCTPPAGASKPSP